MLVTLEELKQAQEDWLMARQQFIMADPEFAEVAVLKLLAAERKYNILLQMTKREPTSRTCQAVNMTGGDKRWPRFGRYLRLKMR